MSAYSLLQAQHVPLSSLFDRNRRKLLVLVIAARGLLGVEGNTLCDPYCSLKFFGDTKKSTVKDNTLDATWGEYFFFCADKGKLLEVQVLDQTTFSKDKLLGKVAVDVSLLQEEDVVDQWYKLDTQGEVHLRLYLSNLPESRPVEGLSGQSHFYSEHLDDFKTGDLILFNGIGFLPSIVKLATNSPYSHVGMVLKALNKYTKEVELYVVEVLKNNDRMCCAFTDQKGPHAGLNIFRMKERLHQFHGSQIWWCPLKEELTRDQKTALTDFIWKNVDVDLTPDVTSRDFVQHTYRYMCSMPEKCGKKEDLLDLVSPTLISNALHTAGILKDAPRNHVLPREMLQNGLFKELVLLREMDKNEEREVDGAEYSNQYYLVTIKEGRNLPRKDQLTESDPFFVVIYLDGKSKHLKELEGKCFMNERNPKWNESFAFRLNQESTPHSIVIDIRDKDFLGFDRVGYVKIPTEEIKTAGKVESKIFSLSPDGGEVIVSLELHNLHNGKDLCTAVNEDNMETVTALVDGGNDINAHFGGQLYTPLQVAVLKNNERMVRYLLEKGADVNRRNNNGKTALHLASHLRGPVAGMLIESGAALDLKDLNGDEPQV